MNNRLLRLRLKLLPDARCTAPTLAKLVYTGLAAATLSTLPARLSAATAAATPVAIIDFNYSDTSGEPVDQTALHQARLAALMSAMRADLTRGGKYKLVSLTCQPEPCSITGTPPTEILDAARRAGARLLLFGGIHKESTLIQWAKLQAVDLKTDTQVVDRLLTFRGDTDEAWRRAEAFMVEQVGALDMAD